MFDLDWYNLGTVFHYHPVLIAYLEVEWRSDNSKGLTLFYDHTKAVSIKIIVQEKR
jgi:hypothetical protein